MAISYQIKRLVNQLELGLRIQALLYFFMEVMENNDD